MFQVRPARAGDLEAVMGIVERSTNDLRAKHGFAPKMLPGGIPGFEAFSLEDDPRGFWVAESGKDIVGYVFSWVCGDFWFLADLFVDPISQNRRIGKTLLGKTFEHADLMEASHRALITFAYNSVATGLYVRHGLFPHVPLYILSGTSRLISSHLVGSDCSCVAVEPGLQSIDMLGRIDEDALGFRRDKHHAFNIASEAASAFLIQRQGSNIGYAYVSSGGHVGPVALLDVSVSAEAVTSVLRHTIELGAEQVSMIVPGPADRCMAAAVDCGLRISEPLVLLASHPFGDWRRYLPRNPGYM